MTIIEDKAQQEGKHERKHKYWERHNIDVIRMPLPVGDYIAMTDRVKDLIERKESRGIPVKKMDFLGTYKLTVDSKYSIEELCSDICGPQHDRFRDECILAQNNGIKLVILVENQAVQIRPGIVSPYIASLEDLHSWVNPRLCIMQHGKQKYPTATKGVTLMKAAMSMRKKYGVEFMFCTPAEAGRVIAEILEPDDE